MRLAIAAKLSFFCNSLASKSELWRKKPTYSRTLLQVTTSVNSNYWLKSSPFRSHNYTILYATCLVSNQNHFIIKTKFTGTSRLESSELHCSMFTASNLPWVSTQVINKIQKFFLYLYHWNLAWWHLTIYQRQKQTSQTSRDYQCYCLLQ